MAEISGYSSDLPTRRREALEHSVTDLFGGAGDVTTAQFLDHDLERSII
jgi:D-amino-acid dehydrogenase